MKTIKIGRKEFEIRSGDYILDNGSCYQLCSGDNRAFYTKEFSHITCVFISKNAMKNINLNSLKKEKYVSKYIDNATKYIFE